MATPESAAEPPSAPPSTVVIEDARESGACPTVDLQRWAALAQRTLAAEGAEGELTLTFVDDDEIADLNRRHMGADGPTDVLSFPLDDDPQPGVPRLLGDVVVAPGVAERQFPTHAGTLDDEIALLVVHGILHVLGHDHAVEVDARRMRAHERRLLESLHWDGPAPEGFRSTHRDES